MALTDPDVALQAIADNLAAALPARRVGRSLVDPAMQSREDMQAGIFCLVTEGGGSFANYLGREADLGAVRARLVGFVAVEEGTDPEEIERAELAMLMDALRWINAPGPSGYGAGVSSIYPEDWAQSKQLEHPYGWIVLSLRLKY